MWLAHVSALSKQITGLNLADYFRLAALLECGCAPDALAPHVEREELRLFLMENPDWWRKAERGLEDIRKTGLQHIYPGLDTYPVGFYDLAMPPLYLTAWGHWQIGKPSLSVVGAREIAGVTQSWMRTELTQFLNRTDCALISGGARGVDRLAHLLCLSSQRPTVVVLPSGIRNIYPKDLRDLSKEILDAGGCFLSEFEPELAMKPFFFQRRNRLIAAMGALNLIVQANRPSGTLVTAQWAVELGRPVGVVPGHPQDKRWNGCLQLIFDGAHLVRDAADLVSLFDAANSIFANDA